MTISVTRLAVGFAARIDGVDITRPVDGTAWAAIRAALDEQSVLVFRGRPLVETAIAVHDFSWSRDQIRPGFFTEKERERLMQRTTVSGNPDVMPAR